MSELSALAGSEGYGACEDEDGTFKEEKEYCNNRLSVAFRADAPTPERWLQYLSELLEPEGIPTLQEYLGYHYHLHVVYVPVVEKQILWSKRCKDKSLVGTVKETII